MNNTKLSLLILILVVGFGLFLIITSKKPTPSPIINSNINDKNIETRLGSKTDKQLAVIVKVTPLNISDNSNEWKFDVSMNNHVIELNQDLISNSILVDDQNNEHKPIRWEGAPAGGHHREGVLIFKSIEPKPKSITLEISGIRDVIRSFNWQL